MNPIDAVAALQAAGWTQVDIAEKAQTTQPNISRILKTGREPGWSLGDRLVRLAQSLQRPRKRRTT